MKKDCKKEVKITKILFTHANLKILRKVRKFLRGRTTAQPHVLESLNLFIYQARQIPAWSQQGF